MDDRRVGSIIRALRIGRRWRQVDLAQRAGVSRQMVSKIERAHLASVTLRSLRVVVGALGVEADVVINGYGRDLDRLLNVRHGAMHEAIARRLRSVGGWLVAPEVSYSVYGERGVIDVLAWHVDRRALLVIELKTSIVDVNDLMGSMDRRRRLGPRVALERGWRPEQVGAWVAAADTPSNHRRLASHATVLRAAFPDDGRTVRRWLKDPAGPLAALSFLSPATGSGARADFRPVRRVDAPRPRSGRLDRGAPTPITSPSATGSGGG